MYNERQNIMTSENNTEKATFGAGCYWGSERAFRAVAGVLDTAVGFMDGIEVVEVQYDSEVISYDDLLEAFWGSHDTSVGSGGERSAIFVDGEQQAEAAQAAKAGVSNVAKPQIKTEIMRVSRFKRAPEREQRYYEKKGE